MVREIIHDPIFLQRKSLNATAADLPIAEDLVDTLRANADRCVGLAANMIGKRKWIIAFCNGPLGEEIEFFREYPREEDEA